jgi:steroid 5-alpha reductase family enzyme
MSGLELAFFALIGLAAVFTVVYYFGKRINNYSVVDVAWSYAFGAMVIFYALAAQGWWMRRMLIAIMVVMWSFRLGTHLWHRVKSHHPEEDGRYVEMRELWKANLGGKMFQFFQLQAISVVVLGLTFLFATTNPTESLGLIEIVGGVLWISAWMGESIADMQLAKFKRDPASKGQVCDVGLWRYTRHPNYFFEWLIWVGFFLVGSAAAWGWTGIIAPAVILYLLLNVTGVPPTEAQSLRSRGDAYRRYQATTNAFFPGPPRD